jgi:hypothetical protein
MLPLEPHSAAAQRRGISSRATFPSLTREASAGLDHAPQVVLKPEGVSFSTRFSLAALSGRLRSQSAPYGSSTSLHPFAPRTLLRFTATTDALTSAGDDSIGSAGGQCLPLFQPLRASWQMGIRPVADSIVPQPRCPGRSPCFLRCTFRPFHLQSPLAVPMRYLAVCSTGLTVGRVSSTDRALAGHASWVSPLASRLTTATGRIEFALLRTGRSPRVALHPASRRRSYLRLRGARRSSARNLTSRMQRHHRRTSQGRQPLVVTNGD